MERYWLIGGGTLLGLLLIASVAISVSRGEAEFDPGSPEFAVQRYVRALVSEDLDAAEALWSPSLKEDCSFEAFALDAGRGLDRLSEARITLEETRVVGQTTVLTVGVVRTTGGGIFGPSEYERSYDFGVRKYDGEWRIRGHHWLADECVSSQFAPGP
ncbi:MAG: nuclear transport factor 2 family protein [Dehalococcoidia bacterium]|nr:nuclear transport factor 2 family protein [Dehalococcoidia bacterium]